MISSFVKKTDMKNSTTEKSEQTGNRWLALAILCTAQFMVIMDTSIIGVALPAIQNDLGYSQSNLQWIFNAYVILFGGLLLLGGKLSDILGPKKVFMSGFVILTLASLLAGLAWSEAVLNISRAFQGIGSALIAPSAMTLLMTIFTDQKELAKAFGFWGASAAAGGSAGVFLGGVLTEYLSWPWVFFINIPIGILVLIYGAKILVKGNKQVGKLDYVGAFAATISLVLLVYSIVTAESNGWISIKTIGFILFSIIILVWFVFRQKRSKYPLMPLSVFKIPNLTAGNIVMFLLAAAWIPLWFFLNLYLQKVLGFSAFYSGLSLLPMTIVIMILMVGFTGKIVGKFGFKKPLIAGLLALTSSLILFAIMPSNSSFWGNVLPASIIAAIGMSLAYIPGTIASMSAAKPEESGIASGIVSTSYQIGSALGLAVIVALSSYVMKLKANDLITEGMVMHDGIKVAFVSAAIISAVAGVISIFYIKQPKSA